MYRHCLWLSGTCPWGNEGKGMLDWSMRQDKEVGDGLWIGWLCMKGALLGEFSISGN